MTAEDLLTHTLREVVESTDYPGTSGADVMARSQAIRHRRRRTTLLVAAVGALVIGGVSAALVLDQQDATEPTPSSRPSPGAMLPDLPQGPAPKVPILYGDVYLTPEGDRITSPAFRHAVSAAATTRGVVAVSQSSWRHPGYHVSLVSGGSTTQLGCGLPGFAFGSGDPVYWLFDHGCASHSAGRLVEGDHSVAVTRDAAPFPVGTLDSGVVVDGPRWLSDPQRHPGIRRRVGRPAVLVVSPDGMTRRIPHLSTAQAATRSEDLVAGLTLVQTRAVVVDASTGAVRWSAPAWTLSHFSSSGRYVSGTQSVAGRPPPESGTSSASSTPPPGTWCAVSCCPTWS